MPHRQRLQCKAGLIAASALLAPSWGRQAFKHSVMSERNDDGSMTVHFGGPEILDGSWTFPAFEPAN